MPFNTLPEITELFPQSADICGDLDHKPRQKFVKIKTVSCFCLFISSRWARTMATANPSDIEPFIPILFAFLFFYNT